MLQQMNFPFTPSLTNVSRQPMQQQQQQGGWPLHPNTISPTLAGSFNGYHVNTPQLRAMDTTDVTVTGAGRSWFSSTVPTYPPGIYPSARDMVKAFPSSSWDNRLPVDSGLGGVTGLLNASSAASLAEPKFPPQFLDIPDIVQSCTGVERFNTNHSGYGRYSGLGHAVHSSPRLMSTPYAALMYERERQQYVQQPRTIMARDSSEKAAAAAATLAATANSQSIMAESIFTRQQHTSISSGHVHQQPQQRSFDSQLFSSINRGDALTRTTPPQPPHPAVIIGAGIDDSILQKMEEKAEEVKRSRTGRRSKKKDPNEPQKPVSSYAMFFRDTQAVIKGHNPAATFGDISKIVAAMWDNLDDKTKAFYKKKTDAAKKDYLKRLAAYRASQVSQDSKESSPQMTSVDSSQPSVSPTLACSVTSSGCYSLSPTAISPPHLQQHLHSSVTMSSDSMLGLHHLSPTASSMMNSDLRTQQQSLLCQCA